MLKFGANRVHKNISDRERKKYSETVFKSSVIFLTVGLPLSSFLNMGTSNVDAACKHELGDDNSIAENGSDGQRF